MCSAMFFLPFLCLLMKDYVHVQNKFDSFTETYLSVLENNIWDWKVFFQDEQQHCRNTSRKHQHMQQRSHFCKLIWREAIFSARVGVSDSKRQGTSTPPTPHTQMRCVLLLNFVVLSRKWYAHCWEEKKKKANKKCIWFCSSLSLTSATTQRWLVPF